MLLEYKDGQGIMILPPEDEWPEGKPGPHGMAWHGAQHGMSQHGAWHGTAWGMAWHSMGASQAHSLREPHPNCKRVPVPTPIPMLNNPKLELA